MKVTTRWECMSIVPELCYVCNEVVKTWRALVCADAHSPSQERQRFPIVNAERRCPSTKTHRGASDWGSHTRHAAGE